MSNQDWIGYTGMLLIITLGLTVLPVFLFQKVITYYGIPIYIFPAVLTLIWAVIIGIKSVIFKIGLLK